MNKIYFLLLFCAQHLFAQDYIDTKSFALASPTEKHDLTPRIYFKEGNSYRKAYLNNVPSEVLGEFMRNYDGASDIIWIVEGQRLTAYFSYNNEKVILNYNKGYLESSRKTYDGSFLSRQVGYFLRNEERSGFVPELVTEVTSNGGTVIEVRMARGSEYCVQRISRSQNGNLELLEKFYYNDAPVK
jgi:hypothetical protein